LAAIDEDAFGTLSAWTTALSHVAVAVPGTAGLVLDLRSGPDSHFCLPSVWR
jgi:hypothetical protein